MTHSDYLIVIPARMASTRLPNKPLADIAGKPMIVRVAEQAQKTGARVVVACDHPSIETVVQAAGIEVVMTQTTHPSGTDRLAEVAQKLALSADAIVVNVQGDEPLIDPALIAQAARTLQAQTDCTIATVAHPIDSLSDFLNPNIVKVTVDQQGRALTFSRAPMPWPRDAFAEGAVNPMLLAEMGVTPLPAILQGQALRHIGLYAYRAGFLSTFPTLSIAPLEKIEALEQMRALWHGYKIAVHITLHQSPAGVDTPDDLLRIQQFFTNSGSC